MTDLLSGRRRGGATAEPSRPRTRAAAPRKPLARGPESLSRRRRAAPASAQGRVGRAGRPHLKDRRTCSGSERPAPRVSLTRARVPGAALLLRTAGESPRGCAALPAPPRPCALVTEPGRRISDGSSASRPPRGRLSPAESSATKTRAFACLPKPAPLCLFTWRGSEHHEFRKHFQPRPPCGALLKPLHADKTLQSHDSPIGQTQNFPYFKVEGTEARV